MVLSNPPFGVLRTLELPYVGLERPVVYVAQSSGITIAEVWGITDRGTLTFSLKHRNRNSTFVEDTGIVIMSSDLLVDDNGQRTTSFNDDTIPAGNVIVLRITSILGGTTRFFHTIVAS